jgi:hypothetical protein
MTASSMATTAAAQIAQLPLLDAGDGGFQEQAEQIARLCGDFETFRELDESPYSLPGIWGAGGGRDAKSREWHIKLRRARNDGVLEGR